MAFAAWAEENPLKIYQNPSGSLPAGLRSLQSSPAGLQISEIPKICENPFPQVKKPKKIFLVRCVDSKSLIP